MTGDVGEVLSAIGGRFAWRYWWPAVPWLADVAMVATFRQENTQEPAGVLFLVCLATVPLLCCGEHVSPSRWDMTGGGCFRCLSR